MSRAPDQPIAQTLPLSPVRSGHVVDKVGPPKNNGNRLLHIFFDYFNVHSIYIYFKKLSFRVILLVIFV